MAAELSQKYVLCLPRGGFNDMIQQIMRCINYCERYDRICVIDTKSNYAFGDHLSNYMDLTHTHIYQSSVEEFYKEAIRSRYTCYPTIFNSDNLHTLPLTYTAELGFSNSGQSATFDFTKHYEEDVIIHSNCGGGGAAVDFFNIFSLKDCVISELRKRWLTLSHPYTALHIRHTDYKSNIPVFLSSNKELIDKSSCIFLASDNSNIIAELKATYTSEKIRCFSNIITTGEKNIHYHMKKIFPDYILDMLCDFLLLIVADEYKYSCVSSNYSRNADRLRATPFRERLLAQLTA